jgi:hypothetical protein
VQDQPTSDPAALEQLPAADQEADQEDPTCATTGVPRTPAEPGAGAVDEADQGS